MPKLSRWLIVLMFLVTALAARSSAASKPQWVRIRNERFDVFSLAGEGRAKAALDYLESAREFFSRESGNSDAAQVTVIVFAGRKEYDQYRPSEAAAAFYCPGIYRDAVVLGNTGDDVLRVAIHEYVHLRIRRDGQRIPLWFNEGLAELYSTMRPIGGQTLVGTPVAGLLESLRAVDWVPLATIVAADHDSDLYHSKKRAVAYYAESWALVHMLTLSEEYSPGSSRFVDELRAGKDSTQALVSTYGKFLSDIDRDLQHYIQSGRFRGSLYPVKAELSASKLKASPAPEFDVRLALAELLDRRTSAGPLRAELDALVTLDPARPEPYVTLGVLADEGGAQGEALTLLGKAWERGLRHPEFLRLYGTRLYEQPARAVDVFGELLKLTPADEGARVWLAQAYIRNNEPGRAISTLSAVRQVTPEHAADYFRAYAYAYAGSQSLDKARAAAERWHEYAGDSSGRADAKALLDRIERTKAAATAAATGNDRPRDAQEAPEFVRRGGLFAPAPVAAPKLVARGRFTRLDCGASTRMTIEDGAAQKVFLLRNPQRLTLNDGDKKAVIIEFVCGPQDPVRMAEVEYALPAAGDKGVEGVAKVISLLP